ETGRFEGPIGVLFGPAAASPEAARRLLLRLLGRGFLPGIFARFDMQFRIFATSLRPRFLLVVFCWSALKPVLFVFFRVLNFSFFFSFFSLQAKKTVFYFLARRLKFFAQSTPIKGTTQSARLEDESDSSGTAIGSNCFPQV